MKRACIRVAVLDGRGAWQGDWGRALLCVCLFVGCAARMPSACAKCMHKHSFTSEDLQRCCRRASAPPCTRMRTRTDKPRPAHATHVPHPPPRLSALGARLARLAELVKARAVVPGCLLWQCAVDQLLVRLVDSHPQVGCRCRNSRTCMGWMDAWMPSCGRRGGGVCVRRCAGVLKHTRGCTRLFLCGCVSMFVYVRVRVCVRACSHAR